MFSLFQKHSVFILHTTNGKWSNMENIKKNPTTTTFAMMLFFFLGQSKQVTMKYLENVLKMF